MAENILDVEDATFDEKVLKENSMPVMVDFWAPWCGPCKAIGPTLEKLADEFGDKVKFFKCNIDENPESPGKYGVRAIPTLIFFKNGEVVEQITGMVSKASLETAIQNVA